MCALYLPITTVSIVCYIFDLTRDHTTRVHTPCLMHTNFRHNGADKQHGLANSTLGVTAFIHAQAMMSFFVSTRKHANEYDS